MKLRFIFFALLGASTLSPINAQAQNLPFKKVFIWGCKMGTHTHGYIHYAFNRAFKHMGFDTYWLDNKDDISRMDFSNSLHISAGDNDKNMPLRDDCRYILHNCDGNGCHQKYSESGIAVILQVYTHDMLTRTKDEREKFIFYDLKNRTIYMPWATDLLPHEIDAIKQQLPNIKKDNTAYFIGSVWGTEQGNYNQVNTFYKACQALNIPFKCTNCSQEEHIKLIQHSYMAPAIQGQWQCEKGYIPCRIFKNISYGAMGITNSKAVYDLFDGKIIYNPDCYQLCIDAQKRLQTLKIEEIYELMDIVKEKHTYINRINHLLKFLDEVKPIE